MNIAPMTFTETLVPGLRLPTIPGLPGPNDAGIDLKALLAPPSPDSLAGRADMFAVKTAQRFRTADANAWAERLAHETDVKLWSDFAKQVRGNSGRVQGWLGTALLAAGMAANAAATQAAKHTYNRPRPFQADAKVVPIGPVPTSSSYPSQHASSAFAAARIVSRLDPSLARDAYNLATQIAVSRVYAGVHYPSDVVAGALLGTGIAEATLGTLGRVLPKPTTTGVAAVA